MSATGHTKRFRALRADRASPGAGAFNVGATLYVGRDFYGCASDDTRQTGVEHGAYCLNESGEPFFTMPREDVELVTDDEVSK